MAAARPLSDEPGLDPEPIDPAEALRRQRLVRELARDVGRFLLEAARAHPGIWEERPEEQAPSPKRRRRAQP